MKELLVFTDKKGNNGIFDYYAREIEESNLAESGYLPLKKFQSLVFSIEMLLQDLSEKITAENENEETIYSYAIEKSKELLSKWTPLFSVRNTHPKIVEIITKSLITLKKYVTLDNIEKKSIELLKTDFDNYFSQQSQVFKELNIKQDDYYESLDDGSTVFNLEKIKKSSHLAKIKRSLDEFKNLKEMIFGEPELDDSEDVIYIGKLKLWIDTRNAEEANRFMSNVASVLSNIEGVEVLIEDTGLGSFWQSWELKIKGWFAKEETKQVISKGLKAAKAYSMDRHIEPIEKIKVERRKTEEDIKRMMSEEQTQELNRIAVEKEKEELTSMKLKNIQSKLEISNKLSELLANGLLPIDSDYRIELNDLLLIEQKDGKINFNDPIDAEDNFEKELPVEQEDTSDGNSTKSEGENKDQ